MSRRLESKSRFLSLVLRHRPQDIGLSLDAEGWAGIDALVALANAKGVGLSRETILEIVAGNDKQRFAIDAGGDRIRANQGHSLAVDLGLAALAPPETLFHGTATRFLGAIASAGLSPRSRRHVHLSATPKTAVNVGARHGTPIVLRVHAGAMHAAGLVFHRAANGVWLTAAVAPGFIEFPGAGATPDHVEQD